MADREMVIKGLECCLPEDYGYTGNNPCIDCPYYHGASCGSQQLLRDALELLKAQEAVDPQLSISGMWYECPVCHRHLTKDRDNYCARCGRSVKWE